jgi:hypothetical protein
MISRNTGTASVMSTLGPIAGTSRTRGGAAVLLCCCAGLGLAACSGGSSAKSPETSVTAPSVGKPAMATSIQAALAKQAFTPYAELGEVAGDGLAPNEAASSLAAACMTDAGYPNDAGDLGLSGRIGDTLTGATVFGAFGYVGASQAAEDGFGFGPGLGASAPSDLSNAAQAATDQCSTIVENFTGNQGNSALAAVQTLGQTIRSEEFKDPSIAQATKAWSTCMAADGYHYGTPNELVNSVMNIFRAASVVTKTATGTTIAPSLTAAQNAAQIAQAEADAACTQSTDLAGIYFAVQASYEQQIVDANQQQLNTTVKQYRAAYQKELASLPTLLRTTPTAPPSHGPKA